MQTGHPAKGPWHDGPNGCYFAIFPRRSIMRRETGIHLDRSMAKRNQEVIVNDLMQTGYRYIRTVPPGANFHPDFKPALTPRQMLEMGVFGGKYMTDCRAEFPASWFAKAKLCHERHEPSLNFFGLNASQPLSVWRQKGWIYYEDPRGWFQWYCRYYMGRRCADDERQIKRWKAMVRHVAQISKNCMAGDLDCRRKQRQALLNWAYDSRLL
jgi:hypothetical protein